MTLPMSRRVSIVFSAALVGVVALAAACSGQGEGERCSTQADNSGNDDCAGSLVCTKAGSLNGSSTDRCCPADRTQATTPVCAVQTAVGVDSGAPATDSGIAADVTTTDTGTTVDAGHDTGAADTGSADAPADG
jgi:hypothetical protein